MPAFDFKIRYLKVGSKVFFEENTLRVWEDQWLGAPEIVKSRLESRFDLNPTLPARVCEVRRINQSESEAFLNKNHLQKSAGAKLKYGLFLPQRYFRLLLSKGYVFDNQRELLVAVMTFTAGKKYYIGNEIVNSFELVRFGTLTNLNVIGGFTKLMRFFVNEKNPGNIMTYVDADWSDGQNFKKMGFEFIEKTQPVYYKIGSHYERITVTGEEAFDVYNSGSLKFIKNGLQQ